jgi:hypothetical protein
MENERIYALYRNFEDAASAINELTGAGFPPGNISVVTNDSEGRFARYVDSNDVHVDGDDAASFGAVTGALIGLGVMAIPGIGPVMAAGPLAAALAGATTGAVAGAATGGLVGTLIDWGTEEDDAAIYERVLIDGGALVIADVTPEWENKVERVFASYGPIDVEDYDLY